MSTWRTAARNVVVAGLLAGAGSSRATLLVYEPFLFGGATPDTAAGQYMTGTGYSSDQLLGQGPVVTGFASDTVWSNQASSGYNSSIYYRMESGQMAYADGSGLQLATSAGQLNLQRNSGASSDSDKNAFRPLSLGGNLPGTLYISFMARMTPGDHCRLSSGAYYGSSTQRFFFGASTTRNPFVTGWSGTALTNVVNSAIPIEADTVHLFVARIRDHGDDLNDEIALFLDPFLSAEGLNTPVAELTLGNFYVAGDANWTLSDVYLRGRAIDTPSSVVVDEVRIGTTWDDVTPYIVPEPATAAALGLGLLLAALRLRARSAS